MASTGPGLFRDHAEPMDIDIYSRDPYYFNYKNPAFNDLMKKVQETADPSEQAKIYGEAQKILAEDVPALYLFVMTFLSAWPFELAFQTGSLRPCSRTRSPSFSR